MSEAVQIDDPVDVICSLKAAVAALECEYKMNRQKAEARRKETRSSEPPMFIMIPLEQERHRENGTTPEDRTRAKRKRRCSDDVNSITSIDCRGKTSRRRSSKCDEGKGPTMRGGVLHNRCGCIHRDGLQDFCPLTECQGQPECLTKPWATCPPAKYYRAQFPDIWPSPASDRNNF